MNEMIMRLMEILRQKDVPASKPTENGNIGFHAEC